MKGLLKFIEKNRKFSYQDAKGNKNEVTVCIIDYSLCLDRNKIPHNGLYNDVNGIDFATKAKVIKNQKYHKFFQFVKSCKDKKIEVIDDQTITFRAVGITERHKEDVYDKTVGQDVALEKAKMQGIKTALKIVKLLQEDELSIQKIGLDRLNIDLKRIEKKFESRKTK